MAVDYVPWAIGGGANVYTPATYQALAVLATGVEPGLADPQLANTTWRLASMTSAALATFISNTLGISVLDDGNLTNLVTNLTSAVSSGGLITPSRTITSSATLNILITDYALAIARVAGIAVMVANLPTCSIGQRFKIADVVGNFQGFPVTATPPGGHNIAGEASIQLNVNRMSAIFQYHGSSTWSVEGVF
jgi:hypothetical protein